MTQDTHTHTPGPWLLRQNASGNWAIASNQSGKQFAGVKFVDEDYLKDELEANARLIAAAPELLEALETAVSKLRQMEWSFHHNGYPGNAVKLGKIADEFDQAIARATRKGKEG